MNARDALVQRVTEERDAARADRDRLATDLGALNRQIRELFKVDDNQPIDACIGGIAQRARTIEIERDAAREETAARDREWFAKITAADEERDAARAGMLNALGARMYAIACKRGDTYAGAVSIPARLAHVHSEVSEAYECVRAGDMALRAPDGKPEGLPAELADVVILVAELAAHLSIDLDAAIAAKMAYNAVRLWMRTP